MPKQSVYRPPLLVLSFLCLALQATCLLAVDTEPIGWATLGGGTTGGAGGPVVTVTNKADFITYACTTTDPYIVQVVGTIYGDFNIPNVKSNKTILGIGYDAKIIGYSIKVSDLTNVIIRNITFTGAVPQDGIISRRAQHVWIDHCTIYDSCDGQNDYSDQCNYVTVSWCKFYYTGKVNDHRFANLVGSGDNTPTDDGYLNITWHHNWWGQYCHERMPRVRYGNNHIFNNYYSCTGNSYCATATWGAELLIENNYFNQVNNPHFFYSGTSVVGNNGITYISEIVASGNIYNSCTGSTSTNGDAFVPAYPYTLDAAADVPAIVMAGAGVGILVGDPNLWPTKATIPSPADGEGNATLNSVLSWRPGCTAVSHNVYFGSAPDALTNYGNQTATTFTPPTLASNTQYYWRIDEVKADSSVITGDLWSFKTVPVLSANLYHYWPFDVDFLDVAKVTTLANNPFGPGNVGLNPRIGAGCLDVADPCDGLMAGISTTATNTIFPTAAPMTISVWFKPTAVPGAGLTGCILSSYVDTVTTAKAFAIELMPAGTCRLTVATATPAFGNSPTMNQWNHILVTINAAGQLRAWLNASETGSITATTTAANNYNGRYTAIGFQGREQNSWQRGEFNGYIDDLAIWNASYDRTFAEFLYNSGSGRAATASSDVTPPTPNPMEWSLPVPSSGNDIAMEAATATDPSGVEYYFHCLTPGGHDSGWQDSTTYVDSSLSPDTTYSYQVKARDKSTNHNETAYSVSLSGTTEPAGDVTPPDPCNMTWNVWPYAIGAFSIQMVATEAADDSGVEYYFHNVTDPNHDSGWQDGTTYVDSALVNNTTYTYTVKARDKSVNQNETLPSTEASATTWRYDCMPIASDWNVDCQVDFRDYAGLADYWLAYESWPMMQRFANDWLLCNRNPSSECWQ